MPVTHPIGTEEVVRLELGRVGFLQGNLSPGHSEVEGDDDDEEEDNNYENTDGKDIVHEDEVDETPNDDEKNIR